MLQGNERKSGFWGNTFNKLKSALSKTKEVVDFVPESAPGKTENAAPPSEPSTDKTIIDTSLKVDDDYLDDLEDKLIKADLGLLTVDTLMAQLRQSAKTQEWSIHQVQAFLKKEFEQILEAAPSHSLKIEADGLNILLIVGVNGTGKTTSIGKLANQLTKNGKKVLIAAGDTFRAAAESQLEIWAKKSNCDILRLASGSDPGAVVFQAVKKAKEESYDVLIIDTAGRLHNKANLMAELRKVQTVIEKNAQGANFEALLVVDASTGQNGIQQARLFSEVVPLTGVILTKLDGSAKGGIVFSIARELKIPVKLIGIGEKVDDLQNFEPKLFIQALFE